MSRQAGQPLPPLIWIGAPAVLCLLVSLALATPVRVFGLALPEPVWLMPPAFAWAVIRPSILGPFVLLAGGVLLDLLWGTPLGLWAAALLIAYAFALLGRPFLAGQATATLAVWYVAAVALAFTAAYLFSMLESKAAPTLTGVVLQFLATALLFPGAYWLIDRFEDADSRYR